jgi:hypothetical protein
MARLPLEITTFLWRRRNSSIFNGRRKSTAPPKKVAIKIQLPVPI